MRQEDEQNNARRSAASGGRVPKQLSSQRVRRHRFEENIPSVWEEEPQKDARVRNRRKADRNLVDREIYDYSHAAIRSDWGSQQAERAARQAAGKFGDAGEKSCVQLRKDRNFLRMLLMARLALQENAVHRWSVVQMADLEMLVNQVWRAGGKPSLVKEIRAFRMDLWKKKTLDRRPASA